MRATKLGEHNHRPHDKLKPEQRLTFDLSGPGSRRDGECDRELGLELDLLGDVGYHRPCHSHVRRIEILNPVFTSIHMSFMQSRC